MKTKVIGLTGSIGMGKSTVAAQCRSCWRGVVSVDADRLVHQLLSPSGKAYPLVIKAFPEVVEAATGQINRQKLAQLVFASPPQLKKLEAILHPLVRQENQHRIRQACRERRPFIVLEIPLLYETGAETLCDAVIVASAPAFLQAQRVLKRTGMTPQKLQEILRRQLPDSQKRKRADAVIQTGLGKAHSFRQVRHALRKLDFSE
jgi:dephospho-CoA kinase